LEYDCDDEGLPDDLEGFVGPLDDLG